MCVLRFPDLGISRIRHIHAAYMTVSNRSVGICSVRQVVDSETERRQRMHAIKVAYQSGLNVFAGGNKPKHLICLFIFVFLLADQGLAQSASLSGGEPKNETVDRQVKGYALGAIAAYRKGRETKVTQILYHPMATGVMPEVQGAGWTSVEDFISKNRGNRATIFYANECIKKRFSLENHASELSEDMNTTLRSRPILRELSNSKSKVFWVYMHFVQFRGSGGSYCAPLTALLGTKHGDYLSSQYLAQQTKIEDFQNEIIRSNIKTSLKIQNKILKLLPSTTETNPFQRLSYIGDPRKKNYILQQNRRSVQLLSDANIRQKYLSLLKSAL